MSPSSKNINPHYRRSAAKNYDLSTCINEIEDNRLVLSYLISKSESSKSEDIKFIQSFLSQTTAKASARRIAISGSPGVGKSTFVNCFGRYLVDKGYKVAVLPVDPTSEVSKGSILGDKTRMDALVGQSGAYVKPMASSLALGGVAPASMVAQMLCMRAGFDYIITETVGVGQSEYEVRHMVDCFILLLQPGGGDELQGIKRGIMEMADLMFVNKADGDKLDSAKLSLKEYKMAVHLMNSNSYGWHSKVGLFSALTGEYCDKVYTDLETYFTFMNEEAKLSHLRKYQQDRYITTEVDKILLELIKGKVPIIEARESLQEQLENKEIDPISALMSFKEKCKNVFE